MIADDHVERMPDGPANLPGAKLRKLQRLLAARGALEALDELHDANSASIVNKEFLGLCLCVAAAYEGLSDEEIVKVKETPALMRYLVKAMKGYGRRITALEKGTVGISKTNDRYRILAEVFLAAGERGGARGGSRRGVWTAERKATAIEAYASHLYSMAPIIGYDTPESRSKPDSRCTPDMQAKAFWFAYEKTFGEEGKHEPRQKKKNMRELERELNKVGCLEAWKGRQIKST